MKTGRNDPCPCGSGQKYKKCCAEKDDAARTAALAAAVVPLPEPVDETKADGKADGKSPGKASTKGRVEPTRKPGSSQKPRTLGPAGPSMIRKRAAV